LPRFRGHRTPPPRSSWVASDQGRAPGALAQRPHTARHSRGDRRLILEQARGLVEHRSIAGSEEGPLLLPVLIRLRPLPLRRPSGRELLASSSVARRRRAVVAGATNLSADAAAVTCKEQTRQGRVQMAFADDHLAERRTAARGVSESARLRVTSTARRDRRRGKRCIPGPRRSGGARAKGPFACRRRPGE
jgi:hypothetical protein